MRKQLPRADQERQLQYDSRIELAFADPDVMAAAIPAIDQHVASAGGAHFAEGDFFPDGRLSRASLEPCDLAQRFVDPRLPAATAAPEIVQYVA